MELVEESKQQDYFEVIDSQTAFEQLQDESQHYAYYLTRAAWEASRICYFQKSYESPILYYLFMKVLERNDFRSLKQIAQSRISEQQFVQIMVYIGTFFNNCGNYLSMGNRKFFPEVDSHVFYQFLVSCEPFSSDAQLLDSCWKLLVTRAFLNEEKPQVIGFEADSSGTNSYYSSNIRRDEAALVQRQLDQLGLSSLNTRLTKLRENEYQLLIASVSIDGGKNQPYKDKVHEFDGKILRFVYGDYSPLLEPVVKWLRKAQNYKDSEVQYKMIENYIDHLHYGDIASHKRAQELWLSDKDPIVESNLGFIETYVDPLEVRGEWEAFVMLKNMDQSKRFNDLAANGGELVKLLPWPKAFEKDNYVRPGFNSVDVLTLASTGIPIGKNLPNYDDIRQSSGFKNLNLGNCYGTRSKDLNKFVDEDQSLQSLLSKYGREAEELKVGLHELLGHGSGKMFTESEGGVKNFDPETIDPLTKKYVSNHYRKGETWHSKFGRVSNAYEECRADAVALYLSCFDEVLQVFLPNRQDEWSDIVYVSWYNALCGGVLGLAHYSNGAWSNPHANGRYVILQVLLQHAPSLASITCIDGKAVSIRLDRELIRLTGKAALSAFLMVI